MVVEVAAVVAQTAPRWQQLLLLVVRILAMGVEVEGLVGAALQDLQPRHPRLFLRLLRLLELLS